MQAGVLFPLSRSHRNAAKMTLRPWFPSCRSRNTIGTGLAVAVSFCFLSVTWARGSHAAALGNPVALSATEGPFSVTGESQSPVRPPYAEGRRPRSHSAHPAEETEVPVQHFPQGT